MNGQDHGLATTCPQAAWQPEREEIMVDTQRPRWKKMPPSAAAFGGLRAPGGYHGKKTGENGMATRHRQMEKAGMCKDIINKHYS